MIKVSHFNSTVIDLKITLSDYKISNDNNTVVFVENKERTPDLDSIPLHLPRRPSVIGYIYIYINIYSMYIF